MSRLFWATLLYYGSLYFSTHNLSFLLLTVLYWLVVWRTTKSLHLSLLAAFVAALPFPKGRAHEILLVAREDIPRWALFDVSYFFPLYLSDVFLASLGYLYVRAKLFAHQAREVHPLPAPLIFLTAFLLWALTGGMVSAFPEVGILSSTQLARMLVIFGLLILLPDQRGEARLALQVLAAAALLFEAAWIGGQHMLGGSLGRDIESRLVGFGLGVGSSENRELLRASGTFFEASIVGTFLLMQMAVVLPQVLQKGKNVLKHIATTALAAGSAGLLLTGSRILYVIWAMGAAWVWIRGRKSFNPGRYVVPLLLLGMLILPYVLTRLGSLSDVFTEYGSASYRIQMIEYAARLAARAPIFGVGIHLSPYYLATGFAGERLVFDPTYPHNLFFQLLAETGFVGAALFALFAASIIRPFMRKLRKGTLDGFGMAAIVYLIASMFYPIFLNHPELSSYFFLYAGIAVFEGKKPRHA